MSKKKKRSGPTPPRRQATPDAEALHQQGLAAAQRGDLAEASALLERAIASSPNYAEAHGNLGVVLSNLGRRDEAIAAYNRALELRPAHAFSHNNLGDALLGGGDLAGATASFRRAVQLRPDIVQFQLNLGNVLYRAGEFVEAAEGYRAAIALDPGSPAAHKGLGAAYVALGRLTEALAEYRYALELAPSSPDLYTNIGRALVAAGHRDEAIPEFERAIELDPSAVDAWGELGTLLGRQGEIEGAVSCLRRAVELKPSSPPIHSNLLFTLHHHPGYDAAALLAEHRVWDERHGHPAGRLATRTAGAGGERLRIGYVSPDFRHHVVAHNLLPVLEAHDRAQFEVFAYANVDVPDSMTARLQESVDHWRDLWRVDDEHAAATIAEDDLDLLVDLSLHSAYNRLPVFAYKPARRQVTYLGYCSTSGMDAMDFRLSDPYLDPDGTDLSVYSEETIRLPRTYWCYSPLGESAVHEEPPSRATGHVTFGCLNNTSKLSADAIDTWGRLLATVDGSRLVLHVSDGSPRRRVSRRLLELGVDPDRIEFVGQQPWERYVETYSRIDVALDPYPYGGGITTCDALWLGVPVVTLSGRTAVGRGGRSLLTNVGLADLVAATPEEYIAIAAELGADEERRGELRTSLRGTMEASPLRDGPGLARDLEAAFREMIAS